MASSLGTVPGRLTVEELAAARAAGARLQIIDVREPWEVEICALPDARNIPLATLPGRLDEVARDRPVVVVCHHGARSQQAVNFLRGQGVPEPLNLTGGVDAWARRVDFHDGHVLTRLYNDGDNLGSGPVAQLVCVPWLRRLKSLPH